MSIQGYSFYPNTGNYLFRKKENGVNTQIEQAFDQLAVQSIVADLAFYQRNSRTSIHQLLEIPIFIYWLWSFKS